MAIKRIDELPAHPKSASNPLTFATALPIHDSALSSDQTRKVTIRDMRGPVIYATDYGAVFDNVTDDTGAIQAAMNAANAIFEAAEGGAETPGAFVEFPVGVAIVTSTLLWKRGVHLRGGDGGGKYLSQIRWNGAAGGTVMQDSGTLSGVRTIEGIQLRKGSAIPANLLKLSSVPDHQFLMANCQFQYCSGDAVQFNGGWLNLHIRDCRFDECGGYALRLVTGPGQNGATFLLDGFTFDNGATASSGFICFDNVSNNVANASTADIRNGRIEINSIMNNPNAIITLKIPAAGANPRFVFVNIANVFYDDIFGTSNDYLLLSSGATADPAAFSIRNFQHNGLVAILGNWTSGESIPLTNRVVWAAHSEGSNLTLLDDTLYFQTFDGGYTNIKFHVGAETNNRLELDAVGVLIRGPGGGTAPATKFLRGSGSPEGAVTAGIGSIFQREDGGAGTSMYVKESGTGNTGWVAK